MKPLTLCIATLLALTSSSFGTPIGIPSCPIYELIYETDPFQSSAFPNDYLSSANGLAVLVSGQPTGLYTYSSNGPLGIWGAGPTTDGCPGYSYLNAHQQAAGYSTLTFGAVATTNWNATLGAPLAKIGNPGPASFLACKRPLATTKKGAYVLILPSDTAVPASFDSGDGDTLSLVSCTPTKIMITRSIRADEA